MKEPCCPGIDGSDSKPFENRQIHMVKMPKSLNHVNDSDNWTKLRSRTCRSHLRHKDAADSDVPGERWPNLNHLSSRIRADGPGDEDRETCASSGEIVTDVSTAHNRLVKRTAEDAGHVHDRDEGRLGRNLIQGRDVLAILDPFVVSLLRTLGRHGDTPRLRWLRNRDALLLSTGR